MQKNNGIGIAAIQIGIPINIFLTNVSFINNNKNTEKIIIFINSKINSKNGKKRDSEGCLSIPGEYGFVTRAANIVIEYLTFNFKKQIISATNNIAKCLQHEIDHCKGKLWIDYQGVFKKNLIKKRMKRYNTNKKL